MNKTGLPFVGIPIPGKSDTFDRSVGFTLVELMVGLVVGAIVLAGAYGLLKTHNEEGYRIERKIELRSEMTLTAKRIQRAVTLAGLGLKGSATLKKEDAVGSDTLIIFTNEKESNSPITADASAGIPVLQVAQPSLFENASYVAVVSDGIGEIRMILEQEGSTLRLDSGFSRTYAMAASMAFPASRERYYSDQDSSHLILEADGDARVIGKNLRNFQVSFHDKHGGSTEASIDVRTVLFSYVGVYPAKEGALNSMVFSSTAIPRNAL
ncbi:MAG: hypothetical protein JWP91_53 [Fibrobacteres bacterium]|nr:hypothetical protein [Fibrobacterota bacterium]